MRKKFYLAVVALCVLVAACSKVGGTPDEDDPNAIDDDDVFPVITVSKPTANQVYVSGDSIIVEGKVTDNKRLYKGKVTIKNDASSFVIAEGYYETHVLSTINYRLAYKAEVTSPTDFSILVEFMDHATNASSAATKVKVNP